MDLQTVLLIVFGTGFGGMIVKEIFNRAKARAETGQINANIAAAKIQLVADGVETMKALQDDLDKKIQKMREQNSQMDALHEENSDLNIALTNAKAIIGYQKEERHEWTLTLQTVLTKNAEFQIRIEQLERKVTELENANEELTKGELRIAGEEGKQ